MALASSCGAEVSRHPVHAREHPRHHPAGFANGCSQRVDGRDDARPGVIVADRRGVEIDHDQRGRPWINRLECVQATASPDDLLDDRVRNAAGMLHE